MAREAGKAGRDKEVTLLCGLLAKKKRPSGRFFHGLCKTFYTVTDAELLSALVLTGLLILLLMGSVIAGLAPVPASI